jgi:hypothetical protein
LVCVAKKIFHWHPPTSKPCILPTVNAPPTPLNSHIMECKLVSREHVSDFTISILYFEPSKKHKTQSKFFFNQFNLFNIQLRLDFIATCNDTYARVVWLYATGCESHASENLFPLNKCHQGPNNDFLIVNCFVTEVPAVPIVESEPLPETTPIQPPNNSPDHAPTLYLMAALALLVAWL